METIDLDIRSKLMFIEYEGKSDGESIKKNFKNNIKPKNLIIIHGDEKSTKEMEDYCKKQSVVQDRIFTPRIGDCVDATVETQIYHVKLKDELVSSLKFQKIKDYELSWIDAVLKPRIIQSENENQTAVQPFMTRNLDMGFSLHQLPKENLKLHKTVFVNDPKLRDLKQIFLQNQIQAEFHDGVLVCNGMIALKKVIFKLLFQLLNFNFIFLFLNCFRINPVELFWKVLFQMIIIKLEKFSMTNMPFYNLN